jgi:ceramide glucosyltransferase
MFITLAVGLAAASFVAFKNCAATLIFYTGLSLTGVSLFYWVATAFLIWRRQRSDTASAPEAAKHSAPLGSSTTSAHPAAPALEPVTFMRPIKRGVPSLPGKLRQLVAAARPGDQVLFGVETPEDFSACEAACAEAAPGVEARVLHCLPGVLLNPKVSKLVQLAPHAAHRAWVVTDAEVQLAPRQMGSLRAEWAQCGAAALTAGYRFEGAQQWQEELDHLPALLTLWPGVVITEWSSKLAAPHFIRHSNEASVSNAPAICPGSGQGLGFTLGACLVIRREDLELIGGWQALGGYLAEDFQIGAKLAALGKPTALAKEVIALDSDRMTWGDWFRHQIRIWRTYRVCRPGGTAGMVLTHGLLWSTVLVLLQPGNALTWLLWWATAGVRILTALAIGRALRANPKVPAILAASALETFFWFVSLLPLKVYWSRNKFKLGPGGTLTV